MLYHHFAPLDRPLSRLVLGTMVFAPDAYELTCDLLDTFVELGGNAVDTAHIYNGGSSERALGRWLEERKTRDRIVILDKGAHHNVDRRRVTPEDITCDLRDSLARLRVDRIDLYLLHRDDPEQPVRTILEALNEHLRAGRIAAIGASNWTPERLEAAAACAREHGLEGFTASSPHLSLARPLEEPWPGCVAAADPESREWYARTGMPLFAWSSQARGFFTGCCTPEDCPDPILQRVYASPENWERLRRARELAARKGGYSATQVALAWVLHQPFPTYALIGPRTVDELRSCVEALEIRLTPEEMRWLDLQESPSGSAAR